MQAPFGKHVSPKPCSRWGLNRDGHLPVAFTTRHGGVAVVVHGDDFTALGTSEGLDKYEQAMCSAFGCKLKGRIGHEATDLKEVRVLNKALHLTQQGLHYEADP